MIGYKTACKFYGILPLSGNEINVLTDDEKAIRQCKIDIINMCTELLKNIDRIETKVKHSSNSESNTSVNLGCIRGKMRNVSKLISEIEEKEI